MSETTPPDSLAVDAVFSSIARLVAASASSVNRVRVSSGQVEVEVEWASAPAAADPAPMPTAPTPRSVPEEHGDEDGISSAPGPHHITAQLVGTFHHAPEPGAKPFVEEGDFVEEGQQVGIIEVMKMMVAVEADLPGRVAAILVPNAQPVEYGQPLISIAPLGDR
ncbi:acetyl-CoA carboxylase biotin carboxyl carrier protein subunit [Streptomonospora sp. PA3]|uniref:acetyl-CoA carboxylase biotin carboxyl carrier protein n=1 Tax=Streptomonospora sp. PA3 TaxID=2607326 RepID=UPI0012DDE937|nr:biotin/lipoyl-containing protein [Streptomonospora sp. PA3]MUL41477.1 acetyl-CoA carboxylase biotin carboxyl carrier protein subunit [Streptomonospora sp. PA3]